MSVSGFKTDDKIIKFTFPSATAIAVNDLLWNNAGVAAKASAQADAGTEALNQTTFADLFLGLSADARLVGETGTATRSVLTDVVVKMTCPSTTWSVGDLVGASEASSGTALEDQQIEKVTDPNAAIGYCVEAGTTVTSVWVRLISRYTPQNVRTILAAEYGDDDPFSLGDSDDFQLLWSTGDASNHAAVVALGDTSQALHITDKGAKGTDWNVGADTHPTVYLHSNTTPATDYLKIGAHDGSGAWAADMVGGASIYLGFDGLEALELAETASAVNHIKLTNAATAGAPLVSAVGDDTNIDLDLQAKGTGIINAKSGVTFDDAKDIAVGTATGTKIGTATSQKIGFYNATPVVQPSAYTQTYSTADKTVAALTLVGTLGGTSDGTLEVVGNTMAGDVSGAIQNNFQDLLAEVTDLKQAINAIIDDLQSLGLAG